MRGVTPAGSHYDVRSVPWVNYFHRNDAIHGYTRANYGFPQSAGCVELPVPTAKMVFPLLYDGTVVTVSGRWRWKAGYVPNRHDVLLSAAPTTQPRPLQPRGFTAQTSVSFKLGMHFTPVAFQG